LGGQVPHGVGVFDADPKAGQPDAAFVQVAGWQITMRDPATFGALDFFTIEEQFDITGIVWAYAGDSSQSVSRLAALTIFQTVEAAVRADPTLGNTVRVCWFSHHAGAQGVTAQGGTGTQIDWALHCEARIS
jgi:hypothetical protein